MTATAPTLDPTFLAAFRAGTLTRDQADAALPTDRAATLFRLLPLSAAVAEPGPAPAGGPHAPSGSLAPYVKPAAGERWKKRGGQAGHPGHARPRPARIDRHETHRLPACPDCGGPWHRAGRTRTRIVEDIPDDLRAEAVEHMIHRDWCPGCRKQVEPRVPDALPPCTLGHRALALAAWLDDGLAVTVRQIVAVFNRHLQLRVTPGGLMQRWHRLAGVLAPWDGPIRRCCPDAGVLHADETGWRVEGTTWWLWCFRTADATYSQLDRSRGHPALDKFFAEEFDGVLVSDFWAAYDAVGRLHQRCWPHLLRELREVDEGHENGADWPDFANRLRRLYGDAIRLVAARDQRSAAAYDVRRARLQGRMLDLAVAEWATPHARRLARRLFKYGEYLLTFVEFAGVAADNNRAEREVRPAVLLRKASSGNQSERGADTRAVLMTVFRTLKRRGHDPLQVITAAPRTYAATGQLPPPPDKIASEG